MFEEILSKGSALILKKRFLAILICVLMSIGIGCNANTAVSPTIVAGPDYPLIYAQFFAENISQIYSRNQFGTSTIVDSFILDLNNDSVPEFVVVLRNSDFAWSDIYKYVSGNVILTDEDDGYFFGDHAGWYIDEKSDILLMDDGKVQLHLEGHKRIDKTENSNVYVRYNTVFDFTPNAEANGNIRNITNDLSAFSYSELKNDEAISSVIKISDKEVAREEEKLMREAFKRDLQPFVLVSASEYRNSNEFLNANTDITRFWNKQLSLLASADNQENTSAPLDILLDWRSVYKIQLYSLIDKMKNVRNTPSGTIPIESIYAIELADLNFDGIPEFFVYYRPAMDENFVFVYTIKNGQIQELLETSGSPQYLDEDGSVGEYSLLQLRSSKLTAEPCFVFKSAGGDQGMYEFDNVYILNKDVSLDVVNDQHGWESVGAEHLFRKYTERRYVNGKDFEKTEYKYKGNIVTESVYTNAYKQFWDEYQPINYKIPSLELQLGHWPGYSLEPDDAEIQNFFDSYIPYEWQRNVKVNLNGNLLTFDQLPIIEDGRTLVPMRAIFEAMGCEVEWINEQQQVRAMKGDLTITMTINDPTMWVADVEYEDSGNKIEPFYEIHLEVPPRLIGGRTLVPVRAISEALGASVEWNEDTYTIEIYF